MKSTSIKINFRKQLVSSFERIHQKDDKKHKADDTLKL